MRRMSVARQTAAAFGDEGDRDWQAEFGGLSLSSVAQSLASGAKAVAPTLQLPVKSSGTLVRASVQAPKLSVMAPPVPAPPKPAVRASAAVATPVSAGGKSAVVARPATAVKPPSSTTAYVTAANQANFLDGGSTPIVSTVRAPERTAAQVEADRLAVERAARARIKDDALRLAALNAPYSRQRQEDTALAMATVTDGIKQPWERAGVDLGLIPMGAKVLAVGASVIATGGAAAGALGVTAAGGSLAAAAAADRLVAAVERGGEIGKQAKDVIDDVKAAAARGDAAAKDALGVVNAVTSGRLAAGVQAGVEQTLTAAGRAAVDQVAGVVGALSGSGALDLGRVAAASGAAAPSSGGFVDMRPQRQVTLVSNRPVGVPAGLLGRGEPRWLVTPEARVVDLERTPSKATAKGFLVTTDGEVSKQ